MELAEIETLTQLADAIVDQSDFVDHRSLLSPALQKEKLRGEVLEALKMPHLTDRIKSSIDYIRREGLKLFSQEEQTLMKTDLDRLASGIVCWEETTYDLQHALGIADDTMQLWCKIGSDFCQQEKFEEATGIFTLLTMLNPNIEGYWLALGGCEQMNGRYDEALRAYQLALDVDTNNPATYLLSAGCHYHLGDADAANEALQIATSFMETDGSSLLADKLASALRAKLAQVGERK